MNETMLRYQLPVVVKVTPDNRQQKIADCLASLDELIQAEERKLDLLKRYRKGLAQLLLKGEDDKERNKNPTASQNS